MTKKKQWELVNINELTANPDNPRTITEEKFDKLLTSVKEFPEMLELRPIVVDENNVVLGGNMRLQACQAAGLDKVPVIKADGLTEEQKREFIIKDNVGFGEWDWDDLANEWEADELKNWGLELPIETETEKLSKLEFEDIYYQPEKKPNIKLEDCLDLTKYHAKLKAIEESPLTSAQKEVLKMFAYRFIKIDFENVANYYFFNASDEEQKIIERLRLVLSDSGLNGFIEDDILMAHELLEGWKDTEE